MRVLIISPQCAVILLRPNLAVVLWCAWVDGQLSPVIGEALVRDHGYVLCYRSVRGDVPSYLLPRGVCD